MITERTICALPEGDINWRHFAIKVQRRSNGAWILNWGGYYYTTSGEWYPSMSEAAEYSEEDALAAAEALAPTIEVNGITVAQALERPGR